MELIKFFQFIFKKRNGISKQIIISTTYLKKVVLNDYNIVKRKYKMKV
jgi:hypothetical protein